MFKKEGLKRNVVMVRVVEEVDPFVFEMALGHMNMEIQVAF